LPGLRHDEFSLIFSASGPMHLRSSQREMYQIGRNCTPATPMANQPKRAAKKPHFLESSLRKRDNFEPFRADVDLRQGHCPNCCKAKFDRSILAQALARGLPSLTGFVEMVNKINRLMHLG
jgi:hypothetical protein